MLYETVRLEREAIPYPWGPIGAQVRDMGDAAGAAVAVGTAAGAVAARAELRRERTELERA